MAAKLPVRVPPALGRSPGTVVAGLTARRAVRSGVIWGYIFGVAIASSALSYAKIYKTTAERDALAATYGSDKAITALFGPAPQLQTVAGFTAFKISMTLIVLGAVWGLLTSTRLLRGEEDGGRWEVLLAGQTTRRGAAAQALGGLGAGVLVLWAVTAVITIVAGQDSSVGIAPGPALYFALAMVATAVMFLAVGALTSQLAATRRQAASYAAAFLGVAYAVRMIADAGVGLQGLIWVSPLGWVEELRPLTAPQPLALLPVAVFTAVVATMATELADGRDVGASLLPDRARSRPHPRLLSGPTGLAIRLARPMTIGWWVAIGVAAALFGLIAKSAGGTISGSSVQQVFAKLGAPGSGADAVLGACFLILAVLVAFTAAGQLTAARSEESGGRLDHLLARPVSRSSWLAGLARGSRRRRGGGRPGRGRLRLARRRQPAHRGQPGDVAGGRPEPRAAGHRDPGPRCPHVRGLAAGDVDRRLRRAGLVAARRHRRRHRGRQPLGTRHLGLPPDGLGPGRGAALGSQRHHGGHRRGRRRRRRIRVPATRPAGRMMGSSVEGGVAFGDLTARARIREAALRHFAEEGYERATIRAIARTAGVSPGLLRHHYGSKEALRQACDDYVFETLHRINAEILEDPGRAAGFQRTSQRFGRYVGRSLVDGSATVGAIFDEMVTMTEQWLARADEARPDPPAVDRRIRAALVTAMAAGVPLLQEHVSRALGCDMFGPEGERLVARGLLDIYSHQLLDPEAAAAARAGFDEGQAHRGS